MVTGVESPWAIVKAGFTRLCFGLGVITLSYFAFAGLRQWWTLPAASERMVSSGLQAKVEALALERSTGASGTETRFHPSSLPAPTTGGFAFPISSPAAEGAATPVPPVAEVPAPIPGVNPETGEGGEGALNALDSTSAVAVPYAYDPSQGGLTYDSAGGSSGSSRSSDSRSESPTPSEAASMQGVLNSGPARAGSGSGTMMAASSSVTSSTLTSQDLSLLSTAVRATFNPQTTTVNGVISGSSQISTATVHNSRWTLNEGLDANVSLSVTGTSSSDLGIHVGFKLQGVDGTYNVFTLNTSVVEVHSRSEVRSGHTFKVFEFRLANSSLRSGAAENLRQLHLVLSYDVSNPSAPQVGNDSVITFVRNQVSMCQTPWSFSTHQGPPAGDPVVAASEISYSLPISNAP